MGRRTRPTVLSVFSGAGGMDVGLEAAGFDTLGVVELDPVARATLALNRPEWEQLGNGDITSVAKDLRPTSIGLRRRELDLLAGGPPCQPFSAAAQWAATGRQGMRDPRAKTVDAFLELIERFLPRAILIENVLGFIQGAHSALEYFENELENIGRRNAVSYSVSAQVLNAADFGVPQNRRRAIVIATRVRKPISWPPAGASDIKRTAWDALYDLDVTSVPQARGKWAALLPSIPEGRNYLWHTRDGGGEELFGDRTRFWNFLLKLDKSSPSWTLAASPGPSTGPFHWANRPLTPRELMRLQSFPDEWQLCGTVRQQVKQAGNATPPLLAEILGRQIQNLLGRDQNPDGPRLLKAPAPSGPPAESPVARFPEQYRDLVGPKEAHAGEGLGPGAFTPSTLATD